MRLSDLDLNRPITDNRDEVIAVKFAGCMKNAAEMYLSAMITTDIEKWIYRYPCLLNLQSKSMKEMYYRLKYFTPLSFLEAMRKPRDPLSKEELTKDLMYLSRAVDPSTCALTSLEVSLHEIIQYSFCQKIVVYDTAMSPNIENYLHKLFNSNISKVFCYEGFLSELVEKQDEITTFFVDDIEDVATVMEYYEANNNTEKLKDKQFFVESLTSLETDEKTTIGDTVNQKYQQYMDEAKTRFGANVTFITSHYVSLGTEDV